MVDHVKMRSPNQGLVSIPASKKWGSASDPRVQNMRLRDWSLRILGPIPEQHFMNSGINPRTLNSIHPLGFDGKKILGIFFNWGRPKNNCCHLWNLQSSLWYFLQEMQCPISWKNWKGAQGKDRWTQRKHQWHHWHWVSQIILIRLDTELQTFSLKF